MWHICLQINCQILPCLVTHQESSIIVIFLRDGLKTSYPISPWTWKVPWELPRIENVGKLWLGDPTSFKDKGCLCLCIPSVFTLWCLNNIWSGCLSYGLNHTLTPSVAGGVLYPTGWVGRRVDLSLAWAWCLQKSCLDCKDALEYFTVPWRFDYGWQSCFHLSAIQKLCWGWSVTVKGNYPQLLKSHLVVGTTPITSVEELFHDLDLSLNEAMISWVVRTGCSRGESPLVNKFLVLFAGKLGTVVTDDFFWSAKHWKTETQGRNHFLRRNARNLLYIWKFAGEISNQKAIFVTLDKYVHIYYFPRSPWHLNRNSWFLLLWVTNCLTWNARMNMFSYVFVYVWPEHATFFMQVSHSVGLIVASWFSLEQNCSWVEDKLSSTTVDFIRSEGYLKNSTYMGNVRFTEHAQKQLGCEKCNLRKAVGKFGNALWVWN